MFNHIRCIYDDPRYTRNHFIKSEINAKFLKKHGIEMTIKDFKEMLKDKRADFIAKIGNLQIVGKFMHIKVYNINDFKAVTCEVPL
ncbi:MAG: hypothetical protein FWE01_01100 [Firmicutes bacterium]|nr:hypothetical protein [Bacillota bacterium]